jgi:hydroxysqualene dehydroxylase
MSARVDVVVVGAGFAGLSAATALAASGARTLVLEARAAAGGRASAFVDPATGERVDNGQHLMLGCYHETLAFLARIGASDRVSRQSNLEVPFIDPAGRQSLLSCPPLPSPLHLLAGVMEWDALGLRDRLSILRLVVPVRRAQRALRGESGSMAASDAETVAGWLVRHGQTRRLRDMLWEPLAVAALNQPIGEAAAPAFVRVLAQMLGPDRFDSALVLPRGALPEVYVAPAQAYLHAHGGEVRVSSPARVRIEHGRVSSVEVRGERVDAQDVVVAVPWFALRNTLTGDTAAIEETLRAADRVTASPIVTVNMWLDRAVLPAPFVGLPGRAFQWVFDRRQIVGAASSSLSFVSSGAASIAGRSNDELAALAHAELVTALPDARPVRLLRHVVVRERRATFSLAPGQPARPASWTSVRGLWLAGDWTETGLPATIEGAVVSGHRAAALAADVGGPAAGREPHVTSRI